MARLDGNWTYMSFCSLAGTTDQSPQLAAPWAPRGVLRVTTDATGKLAGTLTFAPGVELQINGAITPAAGKLPEGIEATGEGLSAVYRLRGFLIAGVSAESPIIVGTVIALENDLGKQPVGTSGPFILFPSSS